MSGHARRSDFAPALTGLVVGGCLLFALLFGVVMMTNGLYAGSEHSTASATR